MADLKIVPFPGGNLNDLPARFRQLADTLEKTKDCSIGLCVVALAIGKDELDLYVWGPDYTKFSAMGLLEAAKVRIGVAVVDTCVGAFVPTKESDST